MFPGLLFEVFLDYLWWCSFCEFLPTVWFGPLSIVAPTQYGEEFWYAAGLFSPIFLLSSRVRKWVIEETSWTYALTLCGIPSYACNVFRTRTILVTLGVAFGMRLHTNLCAIEFISSGLIVHPAHFFLGPKRRYRAVWCHLLALFTLVSTRFMFTTLFPIWASLRTTWFTFILGLICAGFLSHDPDFTSLVGVCFTYSSWIPFTFQTTFDVESNTKKFVSDPNDFSAKVLNLLRYSLIFSVFFPCWLSPLRSRFWILAASHSLALHNPRSHSSLDWNWAIPFRHWHSFLHLFGHYFEPEYDHCSIRMVVDPCCAFCPRHPCSIS